MRPSASHYVLLAGLVGAACSGGPCRPNEQAPPETFVDRGACPFECCTYGTWTATQAFDLVDAIGSTTVIGRVNAGAPALALTGEVHVTPVRVPLTRPLTVSGADDATTVEFAAGTVAEILTPLGEGYAKVRLDGAVYEIMAPMGDEPWCREDPAAEGCWGRMAAPPETQWWVKFRLADRTLGWARVDGLGFEGWDTCA